MDSSQTLIFGGGCFWCVEAVLRRFRGVVSVVSGYAGGTTPQPSYEEVCSGRTGYVEVVRVEFNSQEITLEQTLAVFFATHDPTTPNRQGNDVGEQYRSVIFYTTPEQKQGIEKYIQKLRSDMVFHAPIVTAVEPAPKFYPAEEHHQNYYEGNSEKSYCRFVIAPKIAKLRKEFSHLLK